MNSRRYKTLVGIFKIPPPANLKWRAVESLLIHLEFQIRKSRGSSVSFVRDELIFTTHRPHQRNELLRAQVAEIRKMLEDIGITP